MYEKTRRLSRSRLLIVGCCLCFFLILFVCNHFTDLVADDYRYCFSYADGSRMESVSQIVPSMAAHRQSMNGRVIAHFLVQLFLMLPKPVFELVNALFFTALVWLICRFASWDGRVNALLLPGVFACLWCLQPDFGQVFLWLTGSVNYLWCAVFCLAWLFFWVRYFVTARGLSRPGQIVYVLCSLAVGAYSENATVALVAMCLAFLLLIRFVQKKRPEGWLLFSLAAVLVGFLYMMLAPAESVNKSAEMRVDVLFSNFLENAGYYLRFWPLLLCFALLYALARVGGVELHRRLLALVLLFGSLAGHFVLVFAMYTTGRSTCIALVLLCAANAVLFVPLYETGKRGLLTALCALCLLFTLWRVPVGMMDIRRTHGLLQYNEDFITACAANGERTVEVYRPYAETAYSALAGLPYLNTEDPDDWPNVYMAKYYGVDSIIGY